MKFATRVRGGFPFKVTSVLFLSTDALIPTVIAGKAGVDVSLVDAQLSFLEKYHLVELWAQSKWRLTSKGQEFHANTRASLKRMEARDG